MMLVVLLLFFSSSSLLLLIVISKLIIYNIGLVFHLQLLIYYPHFYFQLLVLPHPIIEYGVLQGSVLESVLYFLYTYPLHSIISKYPGIFCLF